MRISSQVLSRSVKVYLGIALFILAIVLSLGIPILSDFGGGCGGTSTVSVQEASQNDAKINMKFNIEGGDGEIYNINVIIEDSGTGEEVENISDIDIVDGSGRVEIILLRENTYNFIANIVNASDGQIVSAGRVDNKKIELAEETVSITINITGSNVDVDVAFDTQTTSQNEDVVLAGDFSKITIPAGAFDEELSFSINEGVISIPDSENPISNVVTFTFREAKAATKPIKIEITPEGEWEEGSVLTLVNMGEDSESEHLQSNAWIPTLAKYNEEKNNFEVNLYGCAQRLSLVLVSKRLMIHKIDLEESAPVRAFRSSKKIGKAMVSDSGSWSRDWLIACDFINPGDVETLCNEESFISGMNEKVENALKSVSSQMNQNKFPSGVLNTISEDNITYNIAFITDRNICKAPAGFIAGACYDRMETANIYFPRTAVESFDENDLKRTAAHELFHAVEANVNPFFRDLSHQNLGTLSFIYEGFSDFVGSSFSGFDLIQNPPKGERDMGIGFGENIGLNPYQTASDYARFRVTLDNIIPILDGLNDISLSEILRSPYNAISSTLETNLGNPLSDLLVLEITRYLVHRASNGNYERCIERSFSVDEPLTISDTLKPLSAHCYNVITRGDLENVENVTISGNIQSGPYTIILDGQLASAIGPAEANLSVNLKDSYNVWIVNQDLVAHSQIHDNYTYRIQFMINEKEEEEEEEEEEDAGDEDIEEGENSQDLNEDLNGGGGDEDDDFCIDRHIGPSVRICNMIEDDGFGERPRYCLRYREVGNNCWIPESVYRRDPEMYRCTFLLLIYCQTYEEIYYGVTHGLISGPNEE